MSLGKQSGNPFDVGDTIVVCRPDQVCETAIVASCLPADRLTPIVSVEPSPTPRDRHIEWYTLYHQAQQQVQSRIGTPLGRTEVVRGREQAEALSAMDARAWLSTQLAPYRSWAKRNEMMSTIARRMGIERVVFLHEFHIDELVVYDPGVEEAYDRYAKANGLDPSEQGHMFADLPALRLTNVDLADLTTAAWQLLRDPGTEPERVIEVPRDSSDCYPRALFTALRLGAALRAVDGPGTPLAELFDQVNPDGDEAVLVEDTGDATTLVGALYAHHRAARLVVTPRPDLEPVQRAVAAAQARVSAASRSTGVDTRSAGFAGLLERVLFRGGKRFYADVEAAVTSQIPERVIAEVGDRRLTAFTTGIPYSFVRTGAADWSRKPIGHVAADAMLIILNELYSIGMARPGAAFSLIFDPGFFRVSETDDVLRSVRGHFTHPILLSGEQASMTALQRLPKQLPVELIFFNTHGSDNGIELGDVPLSNHLLPQLFELRYRPIVFNNSCQSWTGVGREFVRIGARGYIGTLWDIPSKPAADFARTVMKRLTEDGSPVPQAIVNTGLTRGIERAYLFVGTVNGRLGHWPTEVTGGANLLAHGKALADAAHDCPVELAGLLLREIATLRRAAAHTDATRTVAFADALLDELALIARLPATEDAGGSVDEVVAQLDDTLRCLGLPPALADTRWANRFELTSQLHERNGNLTAALADLDRCLGYRTASRPQADLVLRKAQFLIARGDYERAQQQARAAHEMFTDQHDDAGLMRTLGLLGQLSTRLGQFDEAMDHATRGYAMAVRLEDRREQGAFLLDKCGLQQLGGDHAAATETAVKALETFRALGDESGELTALGKLGGCFRETGNLHAAGGCALTGLEQARKLGKRREVAAFHHDLARVLTGENRHDEALGHYRDAVSTVVELGHWELAAVFALDLVDAAIGMGDGDTLWSAVTWCCLICGQTGQRQWTPVLVKLVRGLQEAFVVSPLELAAQRFPVLFQEFFLENVSGHPDHMILISDLLIMLLRWFVGDDQPGAVRMARMLDAQTDGALRLTEFVQFPYFERLRGR